MNNTCVTLLLCSVLTTFLDGFGTQAVRIDIIPEKCISTTEAKVQISCLSDNDNDQEIKLMEVSRNKEEPLVFINQCDSTPGLRDLSSRIKAVGQIGREGDQSYLNVTIQSPESHDTGSYTCVLYYLDKTGQMNMQTAGGNLLVEKLDVNSLETVLREMKETIRKLKKKNDELEQQEVKVMDRVLTLERTSNGQALDIKGLTEKVNYTTAFSVTNKARITSKSGQVLILPDVLLLVGTGYDVKTGIFTAPRGGLYVFHLVVTDYTTDCGVKMEIHASGNVVARLRAYDKGPGDQSSISSVVNLTAGDTVYTKMIEGGCNLLGLMYTFFNGYLIKVT